MSQDTHPAGKEPGSGSAKAIGYGAGGLGSGVARAEGGPSHDEAFDVMPDGRRAGTSSPGAASELANGEPPPGALLEQPVVATASRPDGHYEADDAQLLKARFTHRPPPGAIASQELGAITDDEDAPEAGAVSDVAIADDDASVWDARPGPDRAP